MEDKKIVCSMNEASKITGVPYKLIRELAHSGKIAHISSGNKILINLPLFIDYLNNSGLKKS